MHIFVFFTFNLIKLKWTIILTKYFSWHMPDWYLSSSCKFLVFKNGLLNVNNIWDYILEFIFKGYKNLYNPIFLHDYIFIRKRFQYPFLNKKVLGIIKDECNGKIIKEFIGLIPKMYSVKPNIYGKEIEKIKGKL